MKTKDKIGIAMMFPLCLIVIYIIVEIIHTIIEMGKTNPMVDGAIGIIGLISILLFWIGGFIILKGEDK